MSSKVTVQIVSASNVGGIYPFVVACFDNDLGNEVYKTAATNGGILAVWNESFTLDLTTHVKNIVADGKPEPNYLTFFMFDTGVDSLPTLGSAGVLLSTVRNTGGAKGDFPVVNGKGSLAIVVEPDRSSKWYQTGTAKVAGAVGAGAVGVALAAGLANMALKKKKSGDAKASDAADEGGTGKKKKKTKMPAFLTSRNREVAEEEEGDEDEEDHHPQHDEDDGDQRRNNGDGNRRWWDPDTDDEDEDDHDEDDVGPPPQQQPAASSRAYPAAQYHHSAQAQNQPYQGDEPAQQQHPDGTSSGSSAGRRAPPPANVPGVQTTRRELADATDFPHHLRAHDEPGEYGGTSYVVDDNHGPSPTGYDEHHET